MTDISQLDALEGRADLSVIENRARAIPPIGPLVTALRGRTISDDGDGEDVAYLISQVGDDALALIARLRAAEADAYVRGRAAGEEEVIQSILILANKWCGKEDGSLSVASDELLALVTLYSLPSAQPTPQPEEQEPK